MPKPYITKDMLGRAIEMRERGLPIEAIARKVGCSRSVLYWHFLKEGVDPPNPRPLRQNHHLQCPVVKRGNHIVRAFTPAEDARLLELERQGLNESAIARALGRKRNSVLGRLMTLARRDERAAA